MVMTSTFSRPKRSFGPIKVFEVKELFSKSSLRVQGRALRTIQRF